MWNFLKGLLGNYKGYQQSKPMTSIVEDVTPATINNILQIPSIFQCVDLIANTMATLPCDVLEETEDGRRVLDKKCNLYFLLNKSPNKHMTPFTFFQTLTLNYLIHGNGFAKIQYAKGSDYVASLTPLNAEQVRVKNKGNSIIYEYYSEDDTIEEIDENHMLHWRNIGNGIIGLSIADFSRTTLTEAANAQNSSINIFKNKGKINGILSSDNLIDKRQSQEFLKTFQEMKNANVGVPLLPSGFKFQQLALSPADTQLLQTREFIVKEFARWFQIPYGMLTGDNANIDNLIKYFYKTKILPMCRSLEQVLMQKIPCKSDSHIISFRLSELNRASDTERSQINATYVQNGIKSRNEVRREEGWIDIEGGDLYTAQTNLAPLDKLGQFDPSQTSQTTISDQPIKN